MPVLAGAPCMPCPFFMFWQLCVALCEAEGEGAAAVDSLLAAVVPDIDDEVVDAGVDELLVAALATAMLTPSPTPSAPAPTAVAIMILPRLDLNVSSSWWRGNGPGHRRPILAAAALQPDSVCGMKSGGHPAGRVTVKTS